MDKVKYVKIRAGQALRRRWDGLRTWLRGLNGWTVARYVFLTAAGMLLYKLGAICALRERGYSAIGGEALALLLPVLHYVVSAIVNEWLLEIK